MRLSHCKMRMLCALVVGSIYYVRTSRAAAFLGTFHFAADCTIARLNLQLAPNILFLGTRKSLGRRCFPTLILWLYVGRQKKKVIKVMLPNIWFSFQHSERMLRILEEYQYIFDSYLYDPLLLRLGMYDHMNMRSASNGDFEMCLKANWFNPQ